MNMYDKVMKNLRVYELAESVVASGYPFRTTMYTEEEFETEVFTVDRAMARGNLENEHLKRAIKLANAKGGGHDQFLTGILVSFDLTFSNKAWVEMERYTFMNFVSSQSTMHRITKMRLEDIVSPNVDPRVIAVLQEKINIYNATQSLEDYRAVLDNLPSGLRLTARLTTNYRCLSNIYHQRRTHRLLDWRRFCDQIELLPMFDEFIKRGAKNDL